MKPTNLYQIEEVTNYKTDTSKEEKIKSWLLSKELNEILDRGEMWVQICGTNNQYKLQKEQNIFNSMLSDVFFIYHYDLVNRYFCYIGCFNAADKFLTPIRSREFNEFVNLIKFED